MTLTLEQVKHIATLARLDLTGDELERYRRQLSAILDHFQQLQSIDTAEIAPTASGFDLRSPLRGDVPLPGLGLDDLLRNAPDTQDQQFRVPPVFE